ncbi:hypothetical protein [Ornithinibacillus scapharcae]|uniref:hypothetical protein n=1 Tax=Ornithinibacillus scapharcae TaxID=1147159 RepID=UPI000225AA68|nr:hypothetical protein [Ornithinibacillus scapharcae]
MSEWKWLSTSNELQCRQEMQVIAVIKGKRDSKQAENGVDSSYQRQRRIKTGRKYDED